MMRKFAEDERLEQLNDQKRRIKQLEHRRAVDKLVLERARIAEQQKQEEEELDRRMQEIEEYKKAVVEQERQRLLREHAGNLAGFLPPVCLFAR
ncbi:MAG: tumor suppressor, Mitostatin-domain-containing protein [Olpidium bornovanus]|uniref:Meiosis-specific nuclear structural protein 1 n=1 Tax=Olpidium bornovanus TaxID=278681 RepID=A0A8H8DGI8_9FUNG|nr:MAG: tumor suppressor, Mitostatin-domain-containing protein [Olpidium bornovanus]